MKTSPTSSYSEFATNIPLSSSPTLDRWCHGAPAVLILLSTVIKQYGSLAHNPPFSLPRNVEDSARVALSRGGKLVYDKGLLRKGVGLCHGVGGTVYALLAVSDVLDAGLTDPSEWSWFLRAVHIAQLAASYERLTKKGEMSIPDRPNSLYEGVAGMCCAWAEVLRRMDGRRSGEGMPGYNDLPDPTK